MHEDGGTDLVEMHHQHAEDIRMHTVIQAQSSKPTLATTLGYPSEADSVTPLVLARSRSQCSAAVAGSSNRPEPFRLAAEIPATLSSTSLATPSDLETADSTMGSPSFQEDIKASEHQATHVTQPTPVRGTNKRRRKMLRDPISTITSSIMVGTRTRKKKKKKQDLVQAASIADSSALAVKDMADTKKASSNHSDWEESTIDQEVGYGDGKGNEGVLRRVYDTWALTSIATANIGPIAGWSSIALSFRISTC